MVQKEAPPPAAAAAASSSDNVISLLDDDEEMVRKASWPECLPHRKADLVLSVVCGNSRQHWALHETKNTSEPNSYAPALFWNTLPFVCEEDKDLYQFFPPQFFERFGCRELAKNPTLENFHKHFSKLRVPFFDVFLVSTNTQHAKEVPSMFKHLPCRIHQLNASDFLPKDVIYETMGADRAASLTAATYALTRAEYESGNNNNNNANKPVLVLDGGTAMTWTATNAEGVFAGGGISPGLGIKLQSLHDRTGALPYIDQKMVFARIQKCEQDKQPLKSFDSNTQDQMLSGVLREIALNLSSVVRQWAAKIRKEEEAAAKENSQEPKKQKLTVVVTGGDCEIMMKLLSPCFSFIVEDDADHTAYMESGEVEIRKCSFLGNRGVSLCLREKVAQQGNLSEVETQRQNILGLRLVHPEFKTPRIRGTVYDIQRTASLDTDKFKVQYDDGSKDVMGVGALYGCLKTFASIGEQNSYGDLMCEERIERKRDARAVADTLIKSMPSLADEKNAEDRKKRSLDMVPEIADKKLKEDEPAKAGSDFEAITLKTVKDNPRSYLRRRIAKHFDDDIYYGTVEAYNGYWRVEYDDGDSEEYDAKDMVMYLKEYELHRTGDTGRAEE